MRCHICDSSLAEPVYNSELGAYEPCPTCLAVIEDTIAGFHDRPSVPEDEFGPLPPSYEWMAADGSMQEYFLPEDFTGY